MSLTGEQARRTSPRARLDYLSRSLDDFTYLPLSVEAYEPWRILPWFKLYGVEALVALNIGLTLLRARQSSSENPRYSTSEN
jgi:hypothetical protein